MHQRLPNSKKRLHGLGVLALVVEAVDLAAGVEEPVEELRERPADGVLGSCGSVLVFSGFSPRRATNGSSVSRITCDSQTTVNSTRDRVQARYRLETTENCSWENPIF